MILLLGSFALDPCCATVKQVLTQYLAAVCHEDLEADIAALLAEVRRLRKVTATPR